MDEQTDSKRRRKDGEVECVVARQHRGELRAVPRAPEPAGGTHVGQLADRIGLHCDVVLLQLLLDFIDALRDVFCLREKQTEMQASGYNSQG